MSRARGIAESIEFYVRVIVFFSRVYIAFFFVVLRSSRVHFFVFFLHSIVAIAFSIIFAIAATCIILHDKKSKVKKWTK